MEKINELGNVNPNHFGYLWAMHKHGRAKGASRDCFGTTTAAYKTLRKLAVMGKITRHNTKTASGYTDEIYSKK